MGGGKEQRREDEEEANCVKEKTTHHPGMVGKKSGTVNHWSGVLLEAPNTHPFA